MKKTSLVLLSVVLAGAAFARDLGVARVLEDDEMEHSVCPVGVCFASPLQLPSTDASIHGLRWNLIYGSNYEVYGLDFGLVGLTRASAVGCQLNAAVAWDNLDMDGVQFSGIGNVVGGSATGVQIGGILNYDRSDFAGFQIAPINIDGVFYGCQFGFFNRDSGISTGLQVGFANAALNEYHGWSFGAVNYADRFFGLQVGAINLASQTGSGVQIGIFNAAATYTGIQIGLLNLIGNGELPIMPVLNAQF